MKQDPSLKDKYKQISKQYKESVAEYIAKKEKKIQNTGNKKLFYSHINRKIRNRSILPPLHNSSNEIIIDPVQKANLLNNHFTSIFTVDSDPNLPFLPPFTNAFPGMSDIVISPKDVISAIQNLKPSVSHTPDNIPALYLKENCYSLAQPLSDLFNISLSLGQVPSIWKLAIVIPIHKKGQTNKVINFRPISLTSVLCRLMEAIIHKHILSHLINNNLLSNFQHGFLPKRSTLTQQLCFLNHLTSTANNHNPTYVAYIDFSKAFDTISHSKLLHVLNHYKLNHKIINWISDLLHQRKQQTLVEDRLSDISIVTSGVPQGSVLGPLAFALYLESLLIKLSTYCKSCSIYAYADDLKITSSDQKDLQNALNIVHQWSTEWNLKIQPTKSEYISFYNKTGPQTHPDFNINNTSIPHNSSVKDLGIILNSNFKWSSHIQQTLSKTTGLAFTLLKSFQTSNPSLYTNLYKTYVRPIIEYNSSTWNPTLLTELRTLEKIQRKFTRHLCRKLNISYTDYSHRLQILNLESLEERRIKTDLTILYKILNDIIEIDFKDHFQFSSITKQYNLRGHTQKLLMPKFSKSFSRNNFFTNRIIPIWNKLPQEIVNSQNLFEFKHHLKSYSIYQIYKTKL